MLDMQLLYQPFKVFVDISGHLTMYVIESEHLATEQTGTELYKILFHAMNSDAVCKMRHAKGLSHLSVGHGMLFVKQRKEGTETQEEELEVREELSVILTVT